jgi:DNA-binding transcriptional LysR family regulator
VRYQNLPTDMLRTFVAVAELKSFTRAGEVMGRTQPAVSLQIRRLEEILNCKLLDTGGRVVALTPEGELLIRYARQILIINDGAVAEFSRRPRVGTLRVGLPIDYAVAFFQAALSHFMREHSEVELEVYCDLSPQLLHRVEVGQLDLAIAMYDRQAPANLAFAWAERPVWAAASDSGIHRQLPVPLVAHHSGCEYRERMTRALDQIDRPWRIAYSTPGISGLQNAVVSGWGVSALTQRTLIGGMRVLTEADDMPPLSDVHVGLHYKHSLLSTAGLLLATHIMKSLQDSGQSGLIKVGRPFDTNMK